MRITLLAPEPSGCSARSITPQVVALLEEWGVRVTTVHPEATVTDLRRLCVDADLYIVKAGSELTLSMAAALDGLGAVMVNPYPATARCRDKIVATRLFQAAGVPVPETYLAARPSELAPLLEGGPLVVKPHRGSKGRGVQVVWDADELADVAPSTGTIFAQRYLEPAGRDRKLYCMGGQLFGVKRVWPVRTHEDKLGEPFTVTPELRDIALRTAEAFGIDLFGLDIIVSGGRPYVVDVNPFPGFKGVPDAALRLADYLYDAAQRAIASRQPSGVAG
jgi:ribosomal protein S6--L-glutamate ligase